MIRYPGINALTDRGRLVMKLTAEEAHRLNHSQAGAEHLLLGLAKEGAGVAANVLKNLGADYEMIRAAVEEFAPPHAVEKSDRPAGADLQDLLQFSEIDAILQFSWKEAQALRHMYVGTEHLLLALLRTRDNTATRALEKLNIDPRAAYQETLLLLGHGD